MQQPNKRMHPTELSPAQIGGPIRFVVGLAMQTLSRRGIPGTEILGTHTIIPQGAARNEVYALEFPDLQASLVQRAIRGDLSDMRCRRNGASTHVR